MLDHEEIDPSGQIPSVVARELMGFVAPSYPAPGVAQPGTCEGQTANMGAVSASRAVVTDSDGTVLTIGGRLRADFQADVDSGDSPLLRDVHNALDALEGGNPNASMGRGGFYVNDQTGSVYFLPKPQSSCLPLECLTKLVSSLTRRTRRMNDNNSYATGKVEFKRDLTESLQMCSVAHTIAWEATLDYPRWRNNQPTYTHTGQENEQRIKDLLRIHPDAFDKHSSEFVQLLEEQEAFASGDHVMTRATDILGRPVERSRRTHAAILSILLEHGANRKALHKAVDKFNQGDRKHGTPERKWLEVQHFQ